MDDTSETLWVVTLGEQSPEQVLMDCIAEHASWQGPFRCQGMAEANARIWLEGRRSELSPGHVRVWGLEVSRLPGPVGFNAGKHLLRPGETPPEAAAPSPAPSVSVEQRSWRGRRQCGDCGHWKAADAFRRSTMVCDACVEG